MKTNLQLMVDVLRSYKISDERVLEVVGRVPRHRFIPGMQEDDASAYGDHPLAIGYGQTISQPFIVAFMSQCLDVFKGMKILEVGTGSGYQAAILAELGAEVYSMERIPELGEHAKLVLSREGIHGVHVRVGNGYDGWPEEAPFDAVIVTCAPDSIPSALVDQLKEGGKMILPIGVGTQELVLLEKDGGELRQRSLMYVRFVPMVKAAHPDSE